jgi:uncharacterized protein (DUF885 family)
MAGVRDDNEGGRGNTRPMNRADLLRGVSIACGGLAVSEGIAATPTDAATHHPADAALDALLAEDWRDFHRRHPESASYQGDRSGDDRWDDPSMAAAHDEASHQRSVLARMSRLDRGKLSDAGKTTYDLYAQQLRDGIRGVELRAYLFALNQRGGVQSDVAIVDSLPFASLRDYEAWAARVDAWPHKVDATIAVLREAIAQRMLWPRIVMERVPAQIDRLLTVPADHPFFAPFKRIPPNVPADAGARLRERVLASIGRGVLPALRRLRAFFVDLYLPAAPVEVGLARVPGGEALYAYWTHLNTTTTLAPRAIHELGLREVARIRAEMERVAPRTGYAGSLPDIFRAMREDPKNYHAGADALLAAYRALAKRIDPELLRFFHLATLPRAPYGVIPIPAAVAPDATTAYYQPGALDGSRAGMYCVNLYRPEQRPIYEMPVLTLHEAVPGHHLQFSFAAELGALPDFRRAAYYVAYAEGWGLYAESLGDEMGLYDDPKAKLGALSYEMWRAVRLVVDTGMHAFGWTRDRAIAYFLDNAAKTKLDVTNEIDRYITDPGQALAYKIGQLKILELRDRARRRLGPRFDLRDFHAVVLGAGSLPLDLLEARVGAWLNSRKNLAENA